MGGTRSVYDYYPSTITGSIALFLAYQVDERFGERHIGFLNIASSLRVKYLICF